MKVFLVLEETSFYQPNFVAELLQNQAYQFVGAALVTKVPPKYSLGKYLQKNWHYLNMKEFIRLVHTRFKLELKSRLIRKSQAKKHYNVASVLKAFDVDFVKVTYNINEEKYVNFIASKEPDVILSSNPLLFKSKILSLPKICCINRHSSLLPAYKGLLPVFHAYRKEEEYTGVTIHTMERKIDAGVILAQGKIKIEPSDTVTTLYQKCFDISAGLCFEALERIREGQVEDIMSQNEMKPSYYSFPTKEDWGDFRKRKGKFI